MTNPTVSGQSWEGLKKIGILIGLLLTDGYMNDKEYKIVYTGKSRILHIKFKETLQELGIKRFTEWKDDKNVRVTQVKNKMICKLVKKFVGSVKTKGNNPIELPKFFWDLLKEYLSEILRYMFSADGCVTLGIRYHKHKRRWTFVRRIELSSKNEFLKKELQKLLKTRFNIEAKIWKKGLVIERKKEILKFSEKIGFVKDIKISKKSKRWKDFEKNEVLNFVCKILMSERMYFKSKKEIEKIFTSLPTAERVQGSTD